MILEKLAELEKLIDVPNVDKHPKESMKAMQMLNLTVEIRGMVKALEKPLPTDDTFSKCVEGCKHFTGGEVKHHEDCPYYHGSFSKTYDDLKRLVRGKTYTAEDMEAFAEWCDKSLYAFHHKSRIWVSYGMGRMITTAQLRELWEQERGKE